MSTSEHVQSHLLGSIYRHTDTGQEFITVAIASGYVKLQRIGRKNYGTYNVNFDTFDSLYEFVKKPMFTHPFLFLKYLHQS